MNLMDLDRCRKAMKNINVVGDPRGKERQSLIEAGIAIIQKEPEYALGKMYLGVKNYASFGDQREDHKYGLSPRHGNIVFKIERANAASCNGPLGKDEIFLLEAVRDTGFPDLDDVPAGVKFGIPRIDNLLDVIRTLDTLEAKHNRVREFLVKTTITSHINPIPAL